MKLEQIGAVGIGDEGSLWIKPAACTFPYIDREAMGVH